MVFHTFYLALKGNSWSKGCSTVEIWKSLVHYKDGLYSDYYEVSNLGNVRSKDRYIVNNKGRKYFVRGKVISQYEDSYGYMEVFLWKDGKSKSVKVHRLVALEFLIDSDNYGDEVNHIDENKKNNLLENLEWCTHLYNNRYGTKNLRADRTKIKNNESNKLKIIIAYNIYTNVEYWLLGLSQVSEFLDTNMRLVFDGIKNRNQVKGYVLVYYGVDYKKLIKEKINKLNNQHIPAKKILIVGKDYQLIVNNAKDAIKKTGVSRSQISLLLNGKKDIVKGFKMNYIEYEYNVKNVDKSLYNAKKDKLIKTKELYKK